MTYLFHDNISGEEREVWLLLPEPLGHNRVCHIEPRDKVPTVKSTIKGGNYIGQKPATLEYPVDGCFTQAVGCDKGRAIPMYQGFTSDIADVHGPPPLVGVHLHIAAHRFNDTLCMGRAR